MDDNEGILDITKRMFEYAGYDVKTTIDGEDVRNLKKPLPDLLLLDLLLSGTDGKELCRHLKNDILTKDLPVIIFSANADLQEIAENCGADGFLPKPFQMKDALAQAEQLTA